MIGPAPAHLPGRVAGFCRLLRRAGFPVAIGEELTMSEALVSLRGLRTEDFLGVCRTTLLKDPARADLFEVLFRAYWLGGLADAVLSDADVSPVPDLPDHPANEPSLRVEDVPTVDERLRDDVARAIRVAMYSPDASSRLRVASGLDARRVLEIRRLARQLRRRLATLPGRRSRPSGRGDIDFRRAARRSLRFAGEWMDLPRRARRLRRTRLVVLWDVSGSMEPRHDEHLAAAYALQRAARSVRTFAFGVELWDVTDLLRAPSYAAAVGRMSFLFRSWSGGTRIGACLAELQRRHAWRIDRRTVVLVMSDGWDVGDLETLERALAAIRRRSGLLVWLNPHASRADFAPEAAGMRAALPYVDVFLSSDVLLDRRAFRRELGPSIEPLAG